MPEIKRVIRKRRPNKKRGTVVIAVDKQILLRRKRMRELGLELPKQRKGRAAERKIYERRKEEAAIEAGTFQFFKKDEE